MTLRKLGTSIPAHNGYPGLLSHNISETKEIVVIGSGPEAQKALEEAIRGK